MQSIGLFSLACFKVGYYEKTRFGSSGWHVRLFLIIGICGITLAAAFLVKFITHQSRSTLKNGG